MGRRAVTSLRSSAEHRRTVGADSRPRGRAKPPAAT